MSRPAEAAPVADLPDAGAFRPLDPALHTPAQRAEIAELEALGYTDGDMPAPVVEGVTRGAERPGLVLWTSGHAAAAYLMRRDGTIVHTWARSWQEVFGDGPISGKGRGTRYWRRVHRFPDQDLLAIFEGHGLVRLAEDSTIRWSLRARVHHDLEVLGDGSILVLARKAHVIEALHPTRPVVDDRLWWISAGGELRRDVSILGALLRSPWAHWVTDMAPAHGDLLHCNSVHRIEAPIPGLPSVQPGHVLVSVRQLQALIVIDPALEQVVWAAQGPWRGQHDAQILGQGRLLLFDNFGLDGGRASAIRELVLPSLRARWTYRGTPEAPFSSPFFGAVQRLPDGHTLVTDSWVGRAFEVTPSGEIVWAFVNPHRVTREGDTFIAVLPQMTSVEP